MLAVFLTQPVPGVRTLISIPAGACRMSIPLYRLYSGAGSILWTLLLAWSGYMLSTWPFANRLIGYVTVVLLVVLVGLYLVRLVRHFHAIRRERKAEGGRPGRDRRAVQPIAQPTTPVNPMPRAHRPKPASATPVQRLSSVSLASEMR